LLNRLRGLRGLFGGCGCAAAADCGCSSGCDC
jgi:hypothetical protein